MESLADGLVWLVAAIHAGIAAAEVLLWRWPLVHRLLGLTQHQADQTATLAANMGLYNGFLAASLVWGLVAAPNPLGVQTFFLSCVAVAGAFGAVTVRWTTLVIQTVPAALAALWFARA